MYANQPYTRGQWNEYVLYDKGHLVPRKTYSDTLERLLSTYTYTNVVPQHHSFNVGMWSTFEGKIREYASDPGHCVSDGGTLYLLTGTAFVHHAHPGNPTHPALLRLGGQNTGIHIPNSLWTAGCCVRPNNDAASFAIIGNNIETPNIMQITVNELQQILREDVGPNGLNIVPLDHHGHQQDVSLFPGNPNCAWLFRILQKPNVIIVLLYIVLK